MPASRGTSRDLAVMLRDGYDEIEVGEISNSGHDYVFVTYRMDETTAKGWYDKYEFLGMQRL